MNERIKLLAEQLGLMDPNYFISSQELEKFAELIVKECAQKLENDGMVEVAMEIKEHFGVAE